MSATPGALSLPTHGPTSLTLSVVIPVWRDSASLAECLRAITASPPQPIEIIVVDDGSPEPEASLIAGVCHSACARLVRLPENRGPATARNGGARLASGDILVFLDADVTVHPDTLQRIQQRLSQDPGLAGVFGSYDDQPAAPGTVSRFRNLLHHYVHHQSAGPASTFWSGCGAIRRTTFQLAGGFDETYRSASIEDVEFGARLYAAGQAILLDPTIQVRHFKRWTLASMFRVDLEKRAIPWTELNLRQRGLPTGLNFAWYKQASVALVALATVLLAARMPLYASLLLALTLILNWRIYQFTARRTGLLALPGGMLAHLFHYFASALGSPAGMLLFFWKRDRWGVALFGTLFAAVVALQIGTGAWQADFITHPDEPAHFVTGIMVGEYFANPTANPVDFARQYYLQYPKLGIGHWPPLHYLIHGVWMRIAGPSRIALMLLLALYAAASATLIYELLWQDTGRILATGSAIAWLALHQTQRFSESAMIDMPGTAFSLFAVLCLRAWMNRPGPGAALLFGFTASLALLTKQTAMAIMLVPAIAIIAGRRLDLARRRDLWLMAVPPAILALAWYLWQTATFYQNLAKWSGIGGVGTGPKGVGPDYFLLLHMAAMPLTVAALTGLVVLVWKPSVAYTLWTAVFCGTFAIGYIFRVSLIEPRYLLFAFASVIALAALLAAKLPRWTHPITAVLLVAATFTSFRQPPGNHLTNATHRLLAGPAGHLIVSGLHDGAIIAAAAAESPEPSRQRYWLRASKLLADVGWGGQVRDVYTTDLSKVRTMLREFGINQVLDIRRSVGKVPKWQDLLVNSLDAEASDWQTEALAAPPGYAVRWYGRRSPVSPAKAISFPLVRLGGAITEEAQETQR